ncbi:hypothetical protein [Paenibacillus sp. 1001270B_150601_E10]|uniref:hypothetical protein n=1 Tax=Paenibacillus sp. 1001270B_150601_E10 TaxID=2787079 RepID=UPI00189FD46A|nr:hypothetical protein [Paenibacillus sp. 1001270B_150601_E10]
MKRANGEPVAFYQLENDEWPKVYKVRNVKIEVSQLLEGTIERYIDAVIVKFDESIIEETYFIVEEIYPSIDIKRPTSVERIKLN